MNKEEQVLTAFRDLFNKLSWLNKAKMESSLKGNKPSEVHCIEYIGRNADSNVTRLAESLYMTRGAISKITQKLLHKGLIESYRKPGNHKEIYFRLTAEGQSIYDIHDKLHREFRERDRPVFEQVTASQYDSMISFMEKYSRHLDEEIKRQELDNNPEST
ncbi:MarR family transcriptional regulator [Paenibacillus tritici]|uniref:MarR family winged helix-turn-helix transcriptional regulator n=1 Tax=Paenibacillus tritici TaxID=1873425 RepID=UPI001BABDA6E|nr:MarR family transcriptional regulator [Paenibacillus tritici]QUL57406.1 MarR family transcriptional regulator [Paenibacillus tritici]